MIYNILAVSVLTGHAFVEGSFTMSRLLCVCVCSFFIICHFYVILFVTLCHGHISTTVPLKTQSEKVQKYNREMTEQIEQWKDQIDLLDLGNSWSPAQLVTQHHFIFILNFSNCCHNATL